VNRGSGAQAAVRRDILFQVESSQEKTRLGRVCLIRIQVFLGGHEKFD